MKQSGLQNLKQLYKRNGMLGKLILVNLAVFLFFALLFVLENTFSVSVRAEVIANAFAGPGNPEDILVRPWALITQMFTHFDPMHFLFNMIALFFVSRIFVQLLGEKRLLTTYILGGLFAYATHVLIYYLVPKFSAGGVDDVVGASGAVMAIFIAVAFLRPKLSVYFFGMIKMPIIVLAIAYIIIDVLSVGNGDNVAHFAHLGGAAFGALSIINVNSPKNFMNRFEKFLGRFKGLFRKKSKLKIYSQEEVQQMDDDQYRDEKKASQEKVDAILDKISKKGYEGLTKEEKEILFNESKRK